MLNAGTNVSLNERIAQLNRMQAECQHEKNKIIEDNEIRLTEEIKNLIDGVGKGFIEGNENTPDKYNSDIYGVRDIHLSSGEDDTFFNTRLVVKLTHQTFLPRTVTVHGIVREIQTERVKKYKHTLRY